MFPIPRATCVAPTGQAAVPSPFSTLLAPIASTIFCALLTSGAAHAR
mgnify:CR=1 FL=1